MFTLFCYKGENIGFIDISCKDLGNILHNDKIQKFNLNGQICSILMNVPTHLEMTFIFLRILSFKHIMEVYIYNVYYIMYVVKNRLVIFLR